MPTLNESLYYLAPLIGFATLSIGIAATFFPEAMSKNFGIAAKGLDLPYVRSTGVRDVFIGLTIFILFYQKNWLALGYIHLFVGIVALSDFAVVFRYGNKRTSLIHLFGAALVFAFGSWLLSR